MHRPHRLLPLAVAIVAAVAGALAGVSAGSPSAKTAWSRISGPTAAGAQLGLARTADGVLHVISNRGSTDTTISETRFSAAGKAGRHVDGRDRLERQRRARPAHDAGQDAAAVRRRHGGHQHLHGACSGPQLGPAGARPGAEPSPRPPA